MSDASSRLDAADTALARALEQPLPDEDAGGEARLLTLEELADAAGTSAAVLEAIERQGFLVPRATGARRYAAADVEAVRDGLALLEAGLPLDELLELARRYDAVMGEIADHAVDLFMRFVRDPVRGATRDEDEAADRLVAAFQRMLPATSRIVAHHFRQRLLAAARQRVAAELDDEPPGPDGSA